MKIENTETVVQDGYPLLKATIDDVETLITPEQKPIMLANGIVFLGSSMVDQVSTEYDGETWEGFTRDKDAFRLVAGFVLDVRNGAV